MDKKILVVLKWFAIGLAEVVVMTLLIFFIVVLPDSKIIISVDKLILDFAKMILLKPISYFIGSFFFILLGYATGLYYDSV